MLLAVYLHYIRCMLLSKIIVHHYSSSFPAFWYFFRNRIFTSSAFRGFSLSMGMRTTFLRCFSGLSTSSDTKILFFCLRSREGRWISGRLFLETRLLLGCLKMLHLTDLTSNLPVARYFYFPFISCDSQSSCISLSLRVMPIALVVGMLDLLRVWWLGVVSACFIDVTE